MQPNSSRIENYTEDRASVTDSYKLKAFLMTIRNQRHEAERGAWHLAIFFLSQIHCQLLEKVQNFIKTSFWYSCLLFGDEAGFIIILRFTMALNSHTQIASVSRTCYNCGIGLNWVRKKYYWYCKYDGGLSIWFERQQTGN